MPEATAGGGAQDQERLAPEHLFMPGAACHAGVFGSSERNVTGAGRCYQPGPLNLGWAAMPDTTTQPAPAAGSTAEAGGADTRRGAASRVAWRRADHDASAYYRDRPQPQRQALGSRLWAGAPHTVRLLRRWVEPLDTYLVDQKRYERWLAGQVPRHHQSQVCDWEFIAGPDVRYSSTACKSHAQRSRTKGATARAAGRGSNC